MKRFLFVMLFISGLAGASEDDAFIERLRVRRIQTELPGQRDHREDDQATRIAGSQSPTDVSKDAKFDSSRPKSSSPNETVIRAIAWTLLIAVIAVGIFGWVTRRGSPARNRTARDVPRANSDANSDCASLPSESDDEAALRFATDGQYDRAIHALLRASLEEIGASHGVVRPAATSREILSAVALVEPQRAALSRLISWVERTHFGNQGTDRAVFELCRSDRELLRSKTGS